MRHLLAFAVAPLLLLACAPADEDEAISAEAAATAEARAQLGDYAGAWKLVAQKGDAPAVPSAVNIVVTDDAVDPTTGATKGTRLRIMRGDAPEVPAIDRAPFVNVDEGKGCENVKMGTASSVSVCHHTVLSRDGKILTHKVTLTSYEAFVFPTGWSTATQVLARTSDGKLRYTYDIDGTPSTDATFER